MSSTVSRRALDGNNQEAMTQSRPDPLPATPPGPATSDADLGSVKTYAFAMISRGVGDRRSPLHTPVLATTTIDGGVAARTVVLRGFDPLTRLLIFHTDRRSQKVVELEANPKVAVTFYDAKAKIQIRCAATAVVHMGDPVSVTAWRRLSAFSRRTYLGAAPGTPISTPGSDLPAELAVELAAQSSSLDETERGFVAFAVVHATLDGMDWLYLSVHGHRRAHFAWDGDGTERATWLVP